VNKVIVRRNNQQRTGKEIMQEKKQDMNKLRRKLRNKRRKKVI
jgi:hypothetical protein